MDPLLPKPQILPKPQELPDTQASSGADSGDEAPDFYYEGPYLVFTEAYHRRRGYCCGSGCRHCRYRERQNEAEAREPARE